MHLPFELGQVVSTMGAIRALEKTNESAFLFLSRHGHLDPGELDEYDQRMNREAITLGNRILSAYKLRDGTRLWIITEWDRSVTTILLPSEY